MCMHSTGTIYTYSNFLPTYLQENKATYTWEDGDERCLASCMVTGGEKKGEKGGDRRRGSR